MADVDGPRAGRPTRPPPEDGITPRRQKVARVRPIRCIGERRSRRGQRGAPETSVVRRTGYLTGRGRTRVYVAARCGPVQRPCVMHIELNPARILNEPAVQSCDKRIYENCRCGDSLVTLMAHNGISTGNRFASLRHFKKHMSRISLRTCSCINE